MLMDLCRINGMTSLALKIGNKEIFWLQWQFGLSDRTNMCTQGVFLPQTFYDLKNKNCKIWWMCQIKKIVLEFYL